MRRKRRSVSTGFVVGLLVFMGGCFGVVMLWPDDPVAAYHRITKPKRAEHTSDWLQKTRTEEAAAKQKALLPAETPKEEFDLNALPTAEEAQD